MARYALKIEYHGGPFSGWQRQNTHRSVQGTVENALRMIDPGVATIAAAGRTDAGVHATGQVAHCDLGREWDSFRLTEALNYHLKPEPIAIVAAARVGEDWHARFSAIERRYTYRIVCRRAPMTLESGLVWHIKHRLDTEAMNTAAQSLVGRHDFTTFRSTMCQADSPVKTLDEARIEAVNREDGLEVRCNFRARSFLHNQVRSFVGTLERVGAGAWTDKRVAQALRAADRSECGPVAPPQGLYLTGVGYPEDPFQ